MCEQSLLQWLASENPLMARVSSFLLPDKYFPDLSRTEASGYVGRVDRRRGYDTSAPAPVLT